MRACARWLGACWTAWALLSRPVLGSVDLMHHELSVDLDPQGHRLVVEDTLTLPVLDGSQGEVALAFFLHRALQVRSLTPGVQLSVLPDRDEGQAADAPTRYALRMPAGAHSVRLRYDGEIHRPIEPEPGDQARGTAGTPGTISAEGVFLGASSHWYPVFGDESISFDLLVRLPAGWDAVSQGDRVLHERDESGTRVRWREGNPQTEIHLAAGRYSEYGREVEVAGRRVAAMAFLRTPDEALADIYLDATGEYLNIFSELFGPYPYGKFALVENFWETGYGMPSFTLLGSTVIRLPFIVHSSYPHEILHNWWGNGVYVDYGRGNWAEGLTAYFADHRQQERRGRGADMRRGQLQRYADYVHEGEDFPLAAFRARHSPASEAIGYGKAMMFFHMLRRELGEEAFMAGLRDFYRERLFRVSGFRELRRALARHAGRDLRLEFEQWVERTGAPQFRLVAASARPLDGGRHELHIVIEQTGPGSPYVLQLPLLVTLGDEDGPLETALPIRGAREEIRLTLPARPLRLEVDPRFDVFRRLDRREIPPALSQSFGARRVTVVLPAAAPAALREGYRTLALAWQGGREPADYRIVDDDELDRLPGDRGVWLLGWENRFLSELRAALQQAPVTFQDGALRLPDVELRRGTHAAVLTARHPEDAGLALSWLAADDPAALPALGRKLPHYGGYGYLGFSEPAADNVAAGQWPVTDSPMARTVVHSGP